MKLLAFFIGCCFPIAWGQSTGSASAVGTCNAPNTGNSSTVTITCYGVDAKLADQIKQLVKVSINDGHTLKEISGKLSTLLQDIGKQTVVITQNNQGSAGNNIAAQSVIVNAASWVLSDAQVLTLKQVLGPFHAKATIWETNGDSFAHSFADSLGKTLASIDGWTAEWSNVVARPSFPVLVIEVSHKDFPAAEALQRLFRSPEFSIPAGGS